MTYTGAGGSNELSVSKAWLFTSSSRHVRVSAAHTRTVFLSGGGMGDRAWTLLDFHKASIWYIKRRAQECVFDWCMKSLFSFFSFNWLHLNRVFFPLISYDLDCAFC